MAAFGSGPSLTPARDAGAAALAQFESMLRAPMAAPGAQGLRARLTFALQAALHLAICDECDRGEGNEAILDAVAFALASAGINAAAMLSAQPLGSPGAAKAALDLVAEVTGYAFGMAAKRPEIHVDAGKTFVARKPGRPS